jgi:hypothetical protein
LFDTFQSESAFNEDPFRVWDFEWWMINASDTFVWFFSRMREIWEWISD